jgi:hypothetical protein
VAKARAYISGGHVYCRVQRADMDIERCFSCIRLRVLADEASPPFIVCDTSGIAPDANDERAFAEWRYQHHRGARQQA